MTAGSESVELTEQMFTIAPLPAAIMAGSTLRGARSAGIRVMLRVASPSSSLMDRTPPVRGCAAPTLLTRMPMLSPARAASSAGPPGVPRSTLRIVTVPSVASLSSSAEECCAPAITCAPLPTRARVTARPMPRLAPVTMALRPVRSIFIMHIDTTGAAGRSAWPDRLPTARGHPARAGCDTRTVASRSPRRGPGRRWWIFGRAQVLPTIHHLRRPSLRRPAGAAVDGDACLAGPVANVRRQRDLLAHLRIGHRRAARDRERQEGRPHVKVVVLRLVRGHAGADLHRGLRQRQREHRRG